MTFTLGRGQVIKGESCCAERQFASTLDDARTLTRPNPIVGWDLGVAGIKVGGERKLRIPAKLAYGSQKIAGIPPNSTLIFDIKCVKIA